MIPEAISVKVFLDILNETLEFAYPLVTVEGEVSGFKVNQNKWVFFDLKDDEASVNVFMPKYQLKVELADGMKVRVSGTPKVTKWGKFSFTARSVELAGEGELKRAFELLRTRLEAEGLFDPRRKRSLPDFPQTIGLITSAQSAAYHDFMKILGARWGGIEVLLADVQVQGGPAPDQIAAAIEYFNRLPEPTDLLVLIRGGGSLEDLQAFNSETVARAVATSRTPIIAGVGHEVDVSLADLAADVRAATPTDAARLATPDRREVAQTVLHQTGRISQSLRRQLAEQEAFIGRQLAVMDRFLNLPQELKYLDEAVRLLDQRRAVYFSRQLEKVFGLSRVLGGYDPTANLRRGYAIVSHQGKVVKSTKQVSAGDGLMVQLTDGKLSTTVDDAD